MKQYVVAFALVQLVRSDNTDCERVLFDQTDDALEVRTMCVEDSIGQRSLVLTSKQDQAPPCGLAWWLEHNPQGVAKCASLSEKDFRAQVNNSCGSPCVVDVDDISNGYVRTMLASLLYNPRPKKLAALCIEMGCTKTIRRTRVNLLQKDTAQEDTEDKSWVLRPEPSKVAVIGLGSSTMATWLRKKLPKVELHIAELVPGVAKAAPCFGLDVADPSLHIHVQDGRAFLNGSADGAYDAILVDAFDRNASLPRCFKTEAFFELARRKLAPGGALSFNLLEYPKDSGRVLKSLVQSFPEDHVWVGNSPGAVGIQEVITAFNPGKARGSNAFGSGLPGRAELWMSSAEYEPLSGRHDLSKFKPLEDSDEKCK